MGRWGDGEMGRWGEKARGEGTTRKGERNDGGILRNGERGLSPSPLLPFSLAASSKGELINGDSGSGLRGV